MIRISCVLAIAAYLASSAVADIAPPPPKIGFKRVPYENVMKLETELAGYKFFTFQQLGIGGKETIERELKLGTENGISVLSSSSPSVRTGVVAVPEKVMDELNTRENLANVLSRDNKDKLPKGVVVYETRGTIRDLKKSDPRSKVVNIITVSRDEKSGVKFTAKEQPPRKTAASKRSPLAMLIAGISMSLAIVMLGAWHIRGNAPTRASQQVARVSA